MHWMSLKAVEHFVVERSNAMDEKEKRIFRVNDPKRASKPHFERTPPAQSMSARFELV
jgi:hypothetical protein